jgi:hypothetical protein
MCARPAAKFIPAGDNTYAARADGAAIERNLWNASGVCP